MASSTTTKERTTEAERRGDAFLQNSARRREECFPPAAGCGSDAGKSRTGPTDDLRYPERMRLLLVAALLAACSCSSSTNGAAGIPVYGYEVVHVYPHDIGAFTEGLFYHDGALYEATGLNGQSSVRKVKLETGEVLEK